MYEMMMICRNWKNFFSRIRFAKIKLHSYSRDASKSKEKMKETEYRMCMCVYIYLNPLSSTTFPFIPHVHNIQIVIVFHKRLNTSIKCIKCYTISKLTYHEMWIHICNQIEQNRNANKQRKSKEQEIFLI